MSDSSDTKVTETNAIETNTTKVARKAARIGVSLDSWAVVLALVFALLVWAGWIKHIPW